MHELTYREAVRDALGKALREDDSVFIMGEDIAEMGGSMAVTQGLLDEFGPGRVRNTPISEMAIVGSGIGAAIQGMRPIVEIMYEDFLTISMEQLVNQAAKHRTMSGGPGQGAAHDRTQGGAGWSPGRSTPAARGLVRPRARASRSSSRRRPRTSAAFSGRRSTTTTRSSSSSTGRCTDQGRGAEELEPIPLGKARVHREGTDVTVVATGRLVHEALKAAEEAEKEGISVEVVDPRTLSRSTRRRSSRR
jgi:pyruvate dehydrogenase E1 component beta subunit